MIDIRKLTKKYGLVTAVNNLSLHIEQGSVFGLLGPNGAGKTTTIKILTTLSKPDFGSCAIGGHDVVQEPMAVKRLIGVAPQENNLDRELSAYENLRIYAMLHNVSDPAPKIRAHLEMVDLWERRDSMVIGFSGGMQRRLLLARALLSEPTVLFLDEPSIGLDPQVRRQMWEIIRHTRSDGRTVVLTTHYIEEAEAVCDEVGILAKGRLIALDTPNRLKAGVGAYVVEFVNEHGRLVQEICRSSEEARTLAQGREAQVTIRTTNLEDVFIKLTGERIE